MWHRYLVGKHCDVLDRSPILLVTENVRFRIAVSAAGLTMLAISGGRHTSELLMRVNREQMRPVQMLGRIDGRADYAPLIG